VNRRSFLGTAAISGCLGYNVVETSRIENRTRRIEHLNLQVNTLEAALNRSQENESRYRRELNSVNDKNLQLEQDLETAKIKHIVSLYEAADLAYRFGNGAWSKGLENRDEQDYSIAVGNFGQAHADYSQSKDLFERAANKLAEYDLTDQGAIQEAIFRMKPLVEAAFDMLLSTYWAAEGDSSTSNNYLSQANNHFDKAKSYNVIAPEDLDIDSSE